MSLLIILIIILIIWGLKPFNGSKIKSTRAKWPTQPELIQVSKAWSDQQNHYSPPGWWDASPSPRGVITLPWQLVLSICTPGWREKLWEWSVLPKNTTPGPSQVSDMTTQLGVLSTDQSSGRVFIWEWKGFLVWKYSSWTAYYGWQLN